MICKQGPRIASGSRLPPFIIFFNFLAFGALFLEARILMPGESQRPALIKMSGLA